MVAAAAPVVVATAILLQSGQWLPHYPSSAISARQTIGRPVILPVDTQNRTRGTMARADPLRGGLAGYGRETRPASPSISDLHLAVHPLEIRFPGLAPVSGHSRFFSDPFAISRYGTMRLPSLPPDRDLFAREILLSAAWDSIPTLSANHNPEAVLAETQNINAHAAIIAASEANRIHGRIKAHLVAHHRHRPQKHGPVALLAKLGRSVMETLARFVD